MLAMRNWTTGMAEDVITYGVNNGVDAWRKLHHDQLPEVEHQKQGLMNQFHKLTRANTLAELCGRLQDIERITSLWTGLADQNFDDDDTLSKLRTPDSGAHTTIHSS